MEAIPKILEAHHVADDLSFILKLQLADLADLEPILLKLNQQGETASIIALSKTVDKNRIDLIE